MNNIVCHKIIEATKEGVTLASTKGNIYISFDDCSSNFSLENGNAFCRCVATRDITTLSFTFYTRPKINIVFKKHILRDVIPQKSAVRKFFDMQKVIVEAGYTSFDLS